MQEDNKQKQLEAKRERTKDLKQQISRLDDQIETLNAQYNHLQQEHDRLQQQYDAVREGRIWKLFLAAKKVQRFIRLCGKYVLGKRDRREIFSRSFKMKKARNRVKKVKYKLYEQGFIDKALAELDKECNSSDNPFVRKLAAWELAVWHADQYKAESAEKCLFYIQKATKKEKNQEFLRKSAILKAESYAILNREKEARKVTDEALASVSHADLYLARANLANSPAEKIGWINQALALFDMVPLGTGSSDKPTVYDGLYTRYQGVQGKISQHPKQPKVTIIIPAYNAADGIQTALDSVLAQTWTNLEVIVADDCSTDGTVQIANAYVQQDPRVQVISNATNSGAYTARNEALAIATGTFVTINDADDWSHPEKIAAQACHLLAQTEVIANTSQQARATEALMFYRRGKPGEYLFANMSSLMFRREPVMEQLGFWGSVRFGADGEFKKRLKRVFGEEAVVDLQTGPYSFQRQSESSLTGSEAFGYHGFFMGARKEYAESYTAYHRSGQSLKYAYPQETRPYPVPEPMLPNREKLHGKRRHFDVIIASEFRLLGGTNMSNIEEIKAQKQRGMKTGLIQMARYDLQSVKEINPKVRELIDGETVQMLVYGEQISCDVLIIRHPPVLQEWQQYIPDVKADHVRVIINQPPKREYSGQGKRLYDIPRCANHVEKYFGKRGRWYPIGPSIREALTKHHSEELRAIQLDSADWVNIIDVEAWRRKQRPANKHIVIGRHARDQYVKWPAERDTLLTIYPDAPDYKIHILGGAKVPKNILGQLPVNWEVHEFGDIDPKDFLAGLDVFVYYTHPDWIEAFGRVIFEAMAAAVPVIIPPSYRALFGEAAIYAEPEEVQTKIAELMQDAEAYTLQVEKARQFVENHFGYAQHIKRLETCFLKANRYIFHE